MIELLLANWPLLATVAVMVVLFLLLRNRSTPVDDVDQVLGQGRPVVVELFSNT